MEDRLIKKLWDRNQKGFITEFSIMQTTNSDGTIEHTYFERNKKQFNIKKSAGATALLNCLKKYCTKGKGLELIIRKEQE